MAVLIEGKKVAIQIREELKSKIKWLKAHNIQVPGLVTILIGEDPPSLSYVTSKSKACIEIGMLSKTEKFPVTITEAQLLNLIDNYNLNDDFHGILVQLPLPKHINEQKVIERISPSKDVDGFNPISVGNLILGYDTFYPCTPNGVMELLKRYKIKTSGKHVVVVGRSNIVGKPVANLLFQKKRRG